MTAKKSDAADLGESEVQDRKAAEETKGYRGVKVDPTPNEHYTFPGQANGLPTPETDDEHAVKASERARKVARGEVSD